MEILFVDNYDSFTFNLVHMLRELCGSAGNVHVVKNDRLGETVDALHTTG